MKKYKTVGNEALPLTAWQFDKKIVRSVHRPKTATDEMVEAMILIRQLLDQTSKIAQNH